MFTFFLYLIFFLVFLFLVLGVSMLRIYRSFFPGNRRSKAPGSSRSSTDSSRTYIEEDESATHKKKVIADDEGEYVDYEEIH